MPGEKQITPVDEVNESYPPSPMQQGTLFHINFQDPSWDAALRALGGKWEKRAFLICNRLNFPLWADVYGGPEITLKIGYDQGRFQEATIARMLGHFQSALKGMAADLSQRVADLP